MTESSQQLPGPLLRGDASRLIAIGFAVTGVLILLLGTSLLVLVQELILGFGFGVYAYVVVGAPLTLASVVALAAAPIVVAYRLWTHDAGAWYVAIACSALLVAVGVPFAAGAGGATWTIPTIGVAALGALWLDRSLYDLGDGLLS